MSAIRLKICGITRPEDALAASSAGADALGLVFYAGSKRCVDIAQARAIVAAIPPFVDVVGLFVNPGRDEVERVLQEIPLSLLQFHGDETGEFCASFQRPYIKALRLDTDSSDSSAVEAELSSALHEHPQARGFLLDSYSPTEAGGTGEVFDWGKLPATLGRPLILAGGLNPGNVADAIRQVGPAAVDVSSGVETAPGIKSAERIQQFADAVRSASS